ncbi:hypothetical protein AMTRI_Chr07g82160 [Amborella trichopoda]
MAMAMSSFSLSLPATNPKIYSGSSFSVVLHRRPRPTRSRAASCSLSDPFVIEIAEKLEDSLSSSSSSSPSLQKLRDLSSQSLLTHPWPTPKQEPFRFYSFHSLTKTPIFPTSSPPPLALPPTALSLSSPLPILIPILDGHFIPSLSHLSSTTPPELYIGSISQNLPPSFSSHLLDYLSHPVEGDLFSALNGVGAPDVLLIHVPSGCKVQDPIHLVFLSSQGRGGSDSDHCIPMSNPRVLIWVEKDGEVSIVEEYAGDGSPERRAYWTNSVVEFVMDNCASVSHSYIQGQAENSTHIKWTFVHQGSCSSYTLVETSTGGELSRHNLHIQQMGPDTVTELSTFHLCGSKQIQDLHSRLVLDHPRGYSRQLHKCIVANSSAKAVFDGNIKVNRKAQQTDAGQLTRSLLLAPRATVNVKPNLQIVADDVKCSHGAAISDLEDDQLFYFRARGVDLQTARNALVFSFGAEVMERLPHKDLRKKVESDVKGLLAAKGAFQ